MAAVVVDSLNHLQIVVDPVDGTVGQIDGHAHRIDDFVGDQDAPPTSVECGAFDARQIVAECSKEHDPATYWIIGCQKKIKTIKGVKFQLKFR